jgi:hypothetical protein
VHNESVQIEITKDEALVLFEFLARFSETGTLELVDQAEERALWNLSCVLEKILVEPFCPDYLDIIKAARDRLRDEVE